MCADRDASPAGSPVSRSGGIFADPLTIKLAIWFRKKSAPFASQMTSIGRSKPFFDMARSALSRFSREARKRRVISSPCKLACEGVGKTHRQLGLLKREPAEHPCLSELSVVEKRSTPQNLDCTPNKTHLFWNSLQCSTFSARPHAA